MDRQRRAPFLPFFGPVYAVGVHSSPTLNRKPMTRISNGMESGRWFVRLFVLLAPIAIAIGVAEWLNPSQPPYKGRLAWVANTSVALFGAPGLALLWFVLAVVLVLAARFVWRHTPKVPSDRWL